MLQTSPYHLLLFCYKITATLKRYSLLQFHSRTQIPKEKLRKCCFFSVPSSNSLIKPYKQLFTKLNTRGKVKLKNCNPRDIFLTVESRFKSNLKFKFSPQHWRQRKQFSLLQQLLSLPGQEKFDMNEISP